MALVVVIFSRCAFITLSSDSSTKTFEFCHLSFMSSENNSGVWFGTPLDIIAKNKQKKSL